MNLPSLPPLRASLLAFAAATLCTLADARSLHPQNGTWSFRFGSEKQQQVTVPHTWNALDAADGTQGGRNDARSVNEDKGYRRGRAVYTRTLSLAPQPGKRYFLRGEGASITSRVRINGKTAGDHQGAFTAFCYEITPLLQAGNNTVEIEVDNSFNQEIAPLGGDFSMFGGLYRPVEIIETGTTCIDPAYYASPGVFIRTTELTPKRADIEVDTRINSLQAGTGTLRITIADERDNTVATSEKAVRFTAAANQPVISRLSIPRPVLWQGTKAPHLYRVTVSLSAPGGVADEVSQPLGLRTVSIDPQRGLLLNGRAMQLRGVSRHQDVQGKGWAVSPEDEQRDIALIADMGATALRTAHYPQSGHLYDLCDRAGLVVWTEVPCVNEVRQTDAFRKSTREQAREMVLQLGNHPSVCMWGVFNEIYHQITPLGRGVDMEHELRGLNALIKTLDPSRFTVSASNQPGRHALNTITDSIAFNMYPGWYGGTPESMGGQLDARLKDHAGRGVAVSEYGHGANPSMHEFPAVHPEPAGQWHPEEWQAQAHEANYREIRKRPAVWGAFIWNMFDFASDARNEGGRPGINDKGLVTYDRRTRKDAFYFYRANWNPALTVHITSGRFEHRTRATVPVKVYSNAREVSLTVNGQPAGKQKPDELQRAVWPEVRLRPGINKLVATARKDGKIQTDTCIWELAPSGNATAREQWKQAGKERP